MKAKLFLLGAGLILAQGMALAGPSNGISMPTVTLGEREIDFKFGSSKSGGVRETAASVGYGVGMSAKWFTEFYVKYKNEKGMGTFFDALEWENKFQVTEPGKYPVDVGFLVEVEHPEDRAEGWEVKWGPLFQMTRARMQFNWNLFFERQYGAKNPAETELSWQFQAKYRLRPRFEYGVQAFGEIGKWSAWESLDNQGLSIGPALFGKIHLGGREAIKFNTAWVFGTTKGSPDDTFRTQVEYEF